MKRTLLTFIGCLTLLPAYGIEDSYLGTSYIASWDFIQSVGGIRIGELEMKGNGKWVLPVICDVSGLNTVTQKPTRMNSGLVVTRMLYRVTDNSIFISIVLNRPLSTNRSSKCTEIDFSGVNVGTYRVQYEGPNKVLHDLATRTFTKVITTRKDQP